MDFALDPALFGVAGPSTSASGRVRDFPAANSEGIEAEDDELGGADDEEEDEEDEDEDDAQEPGGRETSAFRKSAPPSGGSNSKGKTPTRSSENLLPSVFMLPPLPSPQPSARASMQGDGTETDYATDTETRSSKQKNLNRLISAIRDSTVTSGALPSASGSALDQEWDRDLQDEFEELEIEQGMRPAPKNKKTRGRVALADMPPSHEVAALLGQANGHYVRGEMDEAMRAFTEIIRIEPATKAAWETLAHIHDLQGNPDKAILMSIVSAHMSRQTPDVWLALGRKSVALKPPLWEQAIYCFGQALKIDKYHRPSLLARADCFEKVGKPRQAIATYKRLLEKETYSPQIIRLVSPLYHATGDTESAIRLIQGAYEHYKAKVPVPTSGAQIRNFGVQDLDTLSEYLYYLHRVREAARVVREGQRWLQGRLADGDAWDEIGDDREYDLERHLRPAREDIDEDWAESQPVYPLAKELRARLGLCRLEEGNFKEAENHFQALQATHGEAALFEYGQIADAYFEKKQWEQALEYYLLLTQNEETNTVPTHVQLAKCYRALGDLEKAMEEYDDVVETDGDDLESKLALAEICEKLGHRDRALMLVNEVLAARNATEDAQMEYDEEEDEGDDRSYEPSTTGQAKKRARRSRPRASAHTPRFVGQTVTREEREAEERRAQEAFDISFMRLQELDSQLDVKGVSTREELDEALVTEWLEYAAYLVDVYRTTKALFPSDGKKMYAGNFTHFRRRGKTANVDQQAGDLASRLQASIADDARPVDEPDSNVGLDNYRGLSFDDWARLVVRYAFVLTIFGERREAQEVVRHMLTSSNMRQDVGRHQFLLLGLSACAMYDEEYSEAIHELRRIITTRNLETEPLRLFAAVCNSGTNGLAGFVDTKWQKYLLRQVRTIDRKASNAPAQPAADDSDEEAGETFVPPGKASKEFEPTKVNPNFIMMYGHSMSCGQSYRSSLIYYLRAYELRPDDPLVCLSLALAYAHRAMQRQVDNRHHQLSQAIAALNGYRKLRSNEEEIQYNCARIFHQLGILDLAVKHYEKVLSMADERKGTSSMSVDGVVHKTDLSKEAAYNLSSIYFTRNAPDLAHAIVEKYLSI